MLLRAVIGRKAILGIFIGLRMCLRSTGSTQQSEEPWVKILMVHVANLSINILKEEVNLYKWSFTVELILGKNEKVTKML